MVLLRCIFRVRTVCAVKLTAKPCRARERRVTEKLCHAHLHEHHDTLGIEHRRINRKPVMNPAPSSATSDASFFSKLSRAARFVVFLCTAGWLFPHTCTEGMDLTRIQNDDMAKPR